MHACTHACTHKCTHTCMHAHTLLLPLVQISQREWLLLVRESLKVKCRRTLIFPTLKMRWWDDEKKAAFRPCPSGRQKGRGLILLSKGRNPTKYGISTQSSRLNILLENAKKPMFGNRNLDFYGNFVRYPIKISTKKRIKYEGDSNLRPPACPASALPLSYNS